jgi:hypothetical protein
MQATIARPVKTAGRVVLGPRLVGTSYARIVALADGSGRIEVYDKSAKSWSAADDSCGFIELWRAAAVSPALSMAQTASYTSAD